MDSSIRISNYIRSGKFPNITVDFGTKTGSVGVNAYNACGQAGRRAVLVSFNCRLGEMSSSTSVIEISPNPTSTGMVNLTVNSEVNGIALIKMTDILGKSVLNKEHCKCDRYKQS